MLDQNRRRGVTRTTTTVLMTPLTPPVALNNPYVIQRPIRRLPKPRYLVFDRAALESLMRSTERLMHPSSTLRKTSFAARLIALLAMPTLARSQPELHRVLALL